MVNILVINGPNLNMLGRRSKSIYGSTSLAEIEKNCQKLANEIGLKLQFVQNNSEGEIINIIHDALDKFDGIVINAGAYTHTSIAIRDALEIYIKPKVEIHISNIFAREEFRKKSLISDVVNGVISGFGDYGYEIAIRGINNIINSR